MKFPKHSGLPILALAATWLIALWYYPMLPDSVPIHWNAQGIVDDTMHKPWGVLLLPLIGSASLLVLLCVPFMSPRGFRLDSALRTYGIVVMVIQLFLLAVMVIAFENAIGNTLPIERLVPGGVGVLLVILGNYLAKFPKNFFIGIRTPWTLASDQVWYKLIGWVDAA